MRLEALSIEDIRDAPWRCTDEAVCTDVLGIWHDGDAYVIGQDRVQLFGDNSGYVCWYHDDTAGSDMSH